MPENVFIALGSNLDKPINQVKRAIKELGTLSETNVIKTSSLYSSSPQGPQDQEDYVNAVVELDTKLQALDLLTALQNIENKFGRIKTRHWGERVIDLDIVFYDNLVINHDEPDLIIPHPRAFERDFVLIPLLEIQPKFTDPSGKAIKDYLESCSNFDLHKISEDF